MVAACDFHIVGMFARKSLRSVLKTERHLV